MTPSPIGTPFQQTLIDGSQRPGQTVPQKKLGKEDFLTLLVTQLRHQDPLNPMSSTDFTAQLAQFSSLEQLFSVNDSLSGIRDILEVRESGNLLGYIGKRVKTDDNRIALNDHAGQGAYALDGPADVTVFITDENGVLVRKIEEGWKTAGEHTLDWDGRDGRGSVLDDGLYTFNVQARDRNGYPVSSHTYANGEVTGVSYENGTPYLIVGNRRVLPENIITVTQSSPA